MLPVLPLAALILNRDMTIKEANAAFEALVKKPERELCGLHCAQVLEDTGLLTLLEDALTHGTTARIQQMELSLPGGGKCAATVHVTPLWESQDQQSGAMVLIDPLQHAEHFLKKKQQQEKSRAAGLAAAMLAHEIKNPLTSIRSAAQMMHSEEHREYVSLIVREVDRIVQMMTRMEYLSLDAPPALNPVNVHEALRYALGVLSPDLRQRIQVREQFDPSLPEVKADRDLLIQLFLNLIKNAAEAMADVPQPRLLLNTRCGQDFRLMQDGKRTMPIYAEIEDNGPGIPESVISQLFTPFVTTKRGGNGLGLVIAAKIATDLGGSVELLTSQPGCTRWRVVLASS